MRALNFDRNFEAVLRELLRRGHEVHVALEVERRTLPSGAGLAFEALEREFPGFSREQLPPRSDAWLELATPLRHAIDYLRYLEPQFAAASALRERAAARAPRSVRALARAGAARAPLDRLLRRLEGALPVSTEVRSYLERRRPDVVLVSPLVLLGSAQGDYVRAAAALGLPTALLVASWDNLTNKGVVRDVPSLTVVWNAAQAEEAASLHGIPAGRVVATGAHTYDHWFTWRASTTREEFARKVGLDPSRPFLLYACSSWFIGGVEADFVAEWLGRLHADPRLEHVGVLVRPHPQSAEMWAGRDGLREPGRVAFWPPGGAVPTDASRKGDYYDSIAHSAGVVGVNTSALIESAIVGRPVFTVLDDRFRHAQEGTVHFAHLTGGGDGPLVVAETWGEHLDQLAEALAEPGLHAGRLGRFVAAFLRPHGLDVPAAPRVADAIEELVREPPARSRPVGGAAASTARALLPVAVRLARVARRGRALARRTVRARASQA